MKFSPEKLINIRWDNRLRQCQLAAKIGVKPPVVWSWEAGKHSPSGPMLLKLAKAFNVAPEYFFNLSDS